MKTSGPQSILIFDKYTIFHYRLRLFIVEDDDLSTHTSLQQAEFFIALLNNCRKLSYRLLKLLTFSGHIIIR